MRKILYRIMHIFAVTLVLISAIPYWIFTGKDLPLMYIKWFDKKMENI